MVATKHLLSELISGLHLGKVHGMFFFFNVCSRKLKEKLSFIYFCRMGLLQFCNRDCQCSRDADFRPICDSRSSNTFYSPCHAGCTVVENANGSKTYTNCTCIDEPNGEYIGNLEARDGPCYSNNCQSGWLMFEVFHTSKFLNIIFK